MKKAVLKNDIERLIDFHIKAQWHTLETGEPSRFKWKDTIDLILGACDDYKNTKVRRRVVR